MAQVDKARKHLEGRLEPGEELLEAIQVLKPGSTKQFASVGVAGVAGMLGTMAVQRLAGSKPAPEELDPSKQVSLDDAHLGQMATSDRRLFLVPARPQKKQITELPLAGASLSYEDKGKLSLRRRTFVFVAADGRWLLAEAQAGLWKKAQVEAFGERLAGAIESVDR